MVGPDSIYADRLAKKGIGGEDTVSIMAHNCPAHVEVHFGVPMAGAVIELKPGAVTTEEGIILHCRTHMAHFKAPKKVVFGALDKTPTGKIQKCALRERAKKL